MKGKVVCILPVYNEGDRVLDTLKGISKIKEIDEVVLVDDGSTDNSYEVIKDTGHRVLKSEVNMGKGHSIKLALNDLEYDYLLLLDGDLGETSFEAFKLLDPVLEGEADFTIGEFPRAEINTDKKGGFGLVKNLAQRGIEYFTGVKTYNSLSGQRVYRKDVIESITYIPDRYGVEVAMTIQALNSSFVLKEVLVNMDHRYTERNLKGFIHRGKQFKDILKTFIVMYFKGYKR